MSEYMTGVFLACGLFSILNRLSYKSSLDGIRRFALGLLLFSVSAAPMVKMLGNISDFELNNIFPDAEEVAPDDIALYEEAFADGITSAVADKFELRPVDIRVLITGFSASEWSAEKIRIILSGAAVTVDYHKIERYINKMEIGECEVELEIG